MKICNCYDETEIFYHSFGGGRSKIIQRCLGTKECDECSCGGDRAKCNFYPEVKEKAKDEVSIEEAIAHFKYGISHDIFKEPVTSYAKLAVEALEKQISGK